MGYSHYWNHRRKFSQPDWQRLLDHIRAVLITARNEGLTLSFDGDTPLSAHALTGPLDRSDITGPAFSLNGVGDDACESMILHKNRPLPSDRASKHERFFDFCKTRGDPYDTAVVAILCVAETLYPGHIEISSDGEPREWKEGLELARRALPHLADTVDLPAALRFENQWMDHLFTGARYALLLRKDDTICLVHDTETRVVFPRTSQEEIVGSVSRRAVEKISVALSPAERGEVLDAILNRLETEAPAFNGASSTESEFKRFPIS